MPLVLAFGMFLWLVYGIFRNDIAIIVANTFGVACNILLITHEKMVFYKGWFLILRNILNTMILHTSWKSGTHWLHSSSG